MIQTQKKEETFSDFLYGRTPYRNFQPILARPGGNYYYCEAMQGSALPQASLFKGRFGGIVDMTEDIGPPPPATKNRRNSTVSPVVVGLHIEISNRFIDDFERVILFMKWLDDRRL